MKVYLLTYELPYWDGGASTIGIYDSLKKARAAAQLEQPKRKLTWTKFENGFTTANIGSWEDYSIARMDVE